MSRCLQREFLVADGVLAHYDLLFKHSDKTSARARMAWEFLLEDFEYDPPGLTRILDTKSPSGAWNVIK